MPTLKQIDSKEKEGFSVSGSTGSITSLINSA
jgi:hypothetical protein